MRRLAALIASVAVIGGCASSSSTSGLYPAGGSVISNTNIRLTPSLTVSLEHLLYWGGVGAIAYYVVDPLSPNWDIQEARLPDDKVVLSLKMKRYYVGGAGEAREVFQRRARELTQSGGYTDFVILGYSESLDSNAIGSRRTAEGAIALRK